MSMPAVSTFSPKPGVASSRSCSASVRGGAKWALEDPRPTELDAELLVWWMHDRLDLSGHPGVRQVLKIEFVDDPREFWVVVERGVPSVCKTDPGYDVARTVRGRVSDLYRMWLGRVWPSLAHRDGLIDVHGRADWTGDLDRILRLSPAAALVTASRPG
ncbi:hypothetical protein BN11_50028 [Nostocoides australiense Ben110]|uniref:SCP2 domain-containing protein n=1 Tax=Nostocoides australiense Ben110 TaxID=1193182 RepID=W6K0N0_9MICO|nr:hypothetical protein BN11_50028 [Tetrasphaera australiensis Ben110]